ncbi:Large proline-rich protein bag6-A [Sarcoptes scabiei]|nr:Large proline-rich protein bag6-A [Sarcoptes scabiei]
MDESPPSQSSNNQMQSNPDRMDEHQSMESASSPGPTISDLINIKIKTIDSKNYQFQVENDIQIKAFKERIATEVDIEPECQRMIFCGRVLADDKTLKYYKIDNGKVIHLVKRTPPAKSDANSSASSVNQNSNNESNLNSEPRARFRSFRNGDVSSVFMGTFSMDSRSDLINHVMRHVVGLNRSGSQETGSADSTNRNISNEANIRGRFNQIRQILNYIDTNFQILQDPNHIPRPFESISENHQYRLSDYSRFMTNTISYLERLRPYVDTWLQSFDEVESSAERNAETSQQFDEDSHHYSIIMRILHHLSHVFHLLTDFQIDPRNRTNPISLNVLDNNLSNSSGISLSLGSNQDNSNVSSNAVNNSADIAALIHDEDIDDEDLDDDLLGISSNRNIDDSLHSSTNTEINQSGRNDQQPIDPSAQNSSNTTTSASATSESSTTSQPRMSFFTNYPTHSPILLMEVDATINGHRTNLGPRPIPNFSISDLNVTINNLINNASNVTFNTSMSAPPPPPPTSSSSGTNDNNQPADSNDDGQNRNNSSTANNASNTANQFASASNTMNLLPLRFDPYLNCNSSYTLPKIRPTSAGIFESLNPQVLQQRLSQLFDSDNNIVSNIFNSLQTESISPSNSSSSQSDFLNLIEFLLSQMNQLPNFNSLANSPRIDDYLRSLNLFNIDQNNIITNILSFLFRNLNFQDLFQLVNADYNRLDGLRQPLQDSIREFLLSGQAWSLELARSQISQYISENHTTLENAASDLAINPDINIGDSLQNFFIEYFLKFLNSLMNLENNETFPSDVLSIINDLALNFNFFCELVFADPIQGRQGFITNLINTEFLDLRIRTFIINLINSRLANITNVFSPDQMNAVRSTIRRNVRETLLSNDLSSIQSRPMETPLATNNHLNDDNEDVEFSDAFSEIPSASSVPKTESSEEWQSLVPNEWVPIIQEDINKQKNIDNDHPPPFSDAYLSGMSKKRRLENDSKTNENK